MALADKDLTCVDCGAAFTFTVGEQEFFASRGYTNEPKRCTECRGARKNQPMYYMGMARSLFPSDTVLWTMMLES